MDADPPVPGTPDRHWLTPVVAYALLAGGVACILFAAGVTAPASVAALTTFGCALFIAAGGFLGEVVLMHARAAPPAPQQAAPPVRETAESAWSILAWAGRQRQRLRERLAAIDWVGAWAPAGIAFAGAVIAGVLAAAMWRDTAQAVATPTHQQVLGCLLVVSAFPLLLADRVLARRSDRPHGATAQLEVLLRVPLAAGTALGVSSLIRSLGYHWPFLVDRAVIVLVVLVATEVALRAAAQVFLPMPPLALRRTPAASAIARLISLHWPRPGELGAGIQRRFGIDLSRSWALAFLLRALLPVAAGLCLFGWLLTGVTALGIDQRAVYERFGSPVRIVGPGLHAHLPWPFGIMRKVELGVVHEIPIVFPVPGSDEPAPAESAPPVVGAEAVPPASADRLWDSSHPFEASYLIASAAGGQQGFQIVNIDLRVVYRAGLGDAGALAAAYRVADPPALIRAAAGRMLVQHFSRYTLPEVLGENRADFVASFRTELQQRLQRLQAGIDIIAVVVEAIHPPPEAARAYHNVQAAEIRADALVSQSRGKAELALGQAGQQADALLDGARADAAEQVDRAQAASTLFGGDRLAYQRGGQAFLLERWLSHLDNDLAHAPLVIVDHRLDGTLAPTIDLRRFGPTDAPVIPAK